MQILLVNDDGIHAPGLRALRDAIALLALDVSRHEVRVRAGKVRVMQRHVDLEIRRGDRAMAAGFLPRRPRPAEMPERQRPGSARRRLEQRQVRLRQ